MLKLQQVFLPIWLVFSVVLKGQHNLLHSSQNTDDEFIYNITTYNTDNGLAGRYANFIHKDHRGLIWMGTQHGLHRFDGHEFKIFDEDTGLPFNQVMAIYEDAEGWLWLFRSCFHKDKDYCFKDCVFMHSVTHEVKTFEAFFGDEIPFQRNEIEFIRSSPDYQKQIIVTPAATYIYTASKGLNSLPGNSFDESPNIFTVLPNGNMGAYFENDTTFIYYLLNDSGVVIFQEKLSDNNYRPDDFLIKSGTNHESIRRRKAADKEVKFPNAMTLYSERSIINTDGRIEFIEPTDMYAKFNEIQARHIYLDKERNTVWTVDSEGVKSYVFKKQRFKNIPLPKKGHLTSIRPINDSIVFHSLGEYNFKQRKNHWDYNLARMEKINDVDFRDLSNRQNILLTSKNKVVVKANSGIYKQKKMDVNL